MGNILINNNYGDNYTVLAGATVVAGGARAAMMREQMFASQQDDTAGADGVEVGDAELRGEKVKQAILQMKTEKCPGCKYTFFGQGQAYQYAYLFDLMRSGDSCKNYHLPHFNTVGEFLQYLDFLGFGMVCSDQTINNRLKLISGSYPNWEIGTGCEMDNVTAKNVAQRFLCLYRQG